MRTIDLVPSDTPQLSALTRTADSGLMVAMRERFASSAVKMAGTGSTQTTTPFVHIVAA